MKSVEFYEKSGKIRVQYNKKDFSLEEFLVLPEGKQILQKMYYKIITEYDDMIKGKVKDRNNKGEVVGVFIKNYFLEPDKSYDVVILGEEEVMKFNLEK